MQRGGSGGTTKRAHANEKKNAERYAYSVRRKHDLARDLCVRDAKVRKLAYYNILADVSARLHKLPSPRPADNASRTYDDLYITVFLFFFARCNFSLCSGCMLRDKRRVYGERPLAQESDFALQWDLEFRVKQI